MAAAASAYGAARARADAPVEADGQCQDHLTFVVAGGDVLSDLFGLIDEVGRTRGMPSGGLREGFDQPRHGGRVGGIGLQVVLQDRDGRGAIASARGGYRPGRDRPPRIVDWP